MRILLLAWLVLAAFPLPAQDVIFEDDFETANAQAWSAMVPADLVPPTLTITSPVEGDTFDRTPLIVAAYQDALVGIDPASLVVTLDGDDLLADCVVAPDRMVCEPASDLAFGDHVLAVGIADRGGQESMATRAFTVIDPGPDLTPPTLTFLSPAAQAFGTTIDVSLTYTDPASGVDLLSLVIDLDGVPITGGCTLGSSTTRCTDMTLAPGSYALGAQLSDGAGNTANASLAFTLALAPPDVTPPSLSVDAPAPIVSGDATPTIALSWSDGGSGVDATSLVVQVDGSALDPTACVTSATGATCAPPPLADGVHDLDVSLADVAGNTTARDFSFALRLALEVAIDTPVEGLLTAEETVDVSGTVGPGVDTVIVASVLATLTSGGFVASGVPLAEGANTLTVTARSTGGGTGVATINVVRDTTPPRIVLITPTPDFLTTFPQIDIAGEVRDAGSSLVASDDLVVTVNGTAARVSAGSFVAEDFLLQPGRNDLLIRCADAAGNVGESTITVTFADTALARIEPLLGSRQSAPAGGPLAKPLIVRLTDPLGRPLAARDVTFRTSRGDGRLAAAPLEGTRVTVQTDEQGIAQARFTVGTRAGVGNHEVAVTSPGVPGQVVFCASATAGVAARIVPIAGNQQIATRTGAIDQPLPKPLLVQVFDTLGNPVAGAGVTFESTYGDGHFDGAPLASLVTDAAGKAGTIFTLGPLPGENVHFVRAVLDATPERRASFQITGLVPMEEATTSLEAQILGPDDSPVVGATVRVRDTAIETMSAVDGRFVLNDMPAGALHLEIDGSTVTQPGSWVSLTYEVEVVSGQSNQLGTPIRLLPLDLTSSRTVGGSSDVTLSMTGIPGAELTVFAGSATFPDGATVGELTVTQVHSDKVPMVPPMGSDFMFAWTIQPPGVRFDPPARLAIPNADLAAGSVVDIFSFDHAIGEFTSIGTATVSEDGSQIVSDPGFGVLKTGWHGCLPPPPPPGDVCNPGACQTCGPNGPEPTCDRCSTCSCSGGSCPLGVGEGSCEPRSPGTVEITWGLRIDQAFVPVGEAITLRAGLSGGNCRPDTFKWFVDGSQVAETSATLSHTFEAPADTHTVRVEVGCEGCSSLPPSSDDMPVIAVDLEELRVLSGGEDLDDGPSTPEDTHVGAAIFGSGELIVEAVLLPIGAVEPADLPPGFVSWTGGEALSEDQADQIFRQVAKDAPREADLIATVGSTTRTMRVFVYGAEPRRFTPENGQSGPSFPENSVSWESRGFMPGIEGPGPIFGNYKSFAEMEFELVPAGFASAGAAGLFDTTGICFNLGRDRQDLLYVHQAGGEWKEFSADDGAVGWTPDGTGGVQDNDPFDGSGHLYSTDGPSGQGIGASFDRVFDKSNFRERVSCQLTPGGTCSNNPDDFALCSLDYLYWHAFRASSRDAEGLWFRDPLFENEIAPGNLFWGPVPVDEHVEITTTSLPNGTEGQPYDQTLASSSGTPPIAWSLEAGSLPAGMAFGASGRLQGTPTESGSFTFDVQARDSNTPPGADVQTLTLTIDPPQQVAP